MAAAISISGLVKTFGRVRALDGLDLGVETGEVHGFLGPNGAGKSTTLRVLLGLLRADAGTVRLLDGDPWRDSAELHRRLAYVPGDVTLWPNLSGGEVIDLLGRLRGGLNERRRAELLERFELDPKKKGRAYSKGNRQKVALVAALAADVEMLILDEPTSGLDPLMEEVFRECIGEERANGRTVLLSSHILSEVEALCDRVSIIRNGRTVETGSLSDLRHLTRTSISAELAGPPNGLANLARRSRPQRRGQPRALRRRHSRTRQRADQADAGRRSNAGQQSAHARRTLPAPLRRRRDEVSSRHANNQTASAMGALAGTGALVKLGLRRDRIMMPVWVYALTATAVSTAYSYDKLYKTTESRLDFADGVRNNVSTLAYYGHVYDFGSTGGLVAWRLAGIGAALVGVMSILLVVRHTRADEEAGRLELVGAGVVGRYAPLTAGLLIAVGADALLAGLTFAGLIVVGMPALGSLAFGLAWLSGAVIFAAVAAVAAQFFDSTRTTNGVAIAVLGLAYLLRAIGDAGPSWVSWLSPIGWSQQLRPYAAERWWVLALSVALASIVAAGAYVLVGRRDLGAGLLPARPGPAAAGSSLRSPFALAWRLQRGLLFAWTAGLMVYGAAIGGIAQGVNDLVKDSKGTRDLLLDMGGQKGIVDAFIATAMGILGLAASIYAVQAVLRASLGGERSAGRTAARHPGRKDPLGDEPCRVRGARSGRAAGHGRSRRWTHARRGCA